MVVLAFLQFPISARAVHQLTVNRVFGFGISNRPQATVIALWMWILLQLVSPVALKVGTNSSYFFDWLSSLGLDTHRKILLTLPDSMPDRCHFL